MMWDLPTSVELNGKTLKIRNNCDFRVVLDVIAALNDEDLPEKNRIVCALVIFYENHNDIEDMTAATVEMFKIINNGEIEDPNSPEKPRLIDWSHDFKQMAPPISRVLGYDIRTPEKYTHWYTFLGGYTEMGGDCTFASIVGIRQKKQKGKKLDKWEIDFLRENRQMVELPQKLTAEEEEWLNSEW